MFSLSMKHRSILGVAIFMMFSLPACQASTLTEADVGASVDEPVQLAAAETAKPAVDLSAPLLEFRGTISGDLLDLNDGLGEDTPAVQEFLRTGKNPYNGDAAHIQSGHSHYLTACSGCHGGDAEGKIGPALHDDYWTYPKNVYDKGFFETIYGGADGMMGPQRKHLSKDEILQVMSWVRSVYDGAPKKAKWLE